MLRDFRFQLQARNLVHFRTFEFLRRTHCCWIMFAYLTSRILPGVEADSCSAISWNKETDALVAGRTDGVVLVRYLNLKGPVAVANYGPKTPTENPPNQDQDLRNHQVPVRSIAWNMAQAVIATGDSEGVTTVWKLDPKTHKWHNSMATRTLKSEVTSMEWTKDGELIAIVYENGSVMIGKIDGIKVASFDVKHARIPAWSPDGEELLIATATGQVLIFDKTGKNTGTVSLPWTSIEKSPSAAVVALKWHGSENSAGKRLLVALEDGRYAIFANSADTQPSSFQLPMKICCADWTSAGRHIALGGCSKKSAAFPEELALVMIVAVNGKHECLMRLKYNNVDAVSWDSTGRRLALLLDSKLYFLSVKRPVKFCHFESVLAYVPTGDEPADALLIFYNTKTEKRVAVKHYTGQRILSLTAGSDFCVAATQVINEAYQYNIYVFNDTGATINVFFTNIEPLFTAANDHQVFAASREVIFAWNFRQAAVASTVLENAVTRWDVGERYFHVDDAQGMIDLKTGRQRLYEVSIDPICAITASKDTLIVGRESGNMVRYSLPAIRWDREYQNVLPSARKIALNADSSRLLLLNSHTGVCLMYALKEIRLTKDSPAVKDVKIVIDRKDVWDFIWAEDDPDLYAVSHKNRVYVYRNKDAEDPIPNEGYFCRFINLEMLVVNTDDLLRSENPTEVAANCVQTIKTKTLRETCNILATSSLAEVQKYVDIHSHPVLWNLLADKATQKLDLDLAEVCYIRGQNWKGIKFVKRLRNLKDQRIVKAEVYAFFGDPHRAEQEYQDAGRSDLACDFRKASGDWFRLKEMALDGQNENLLREADEGMGRYFYDRQQWQEAAKHFEAARDYKSLFKVYMLTSDIEKLEKLAEKLPPSHFLLVDIGQLLDRYGYSSAALKILKKADRSDLAIEAGIRNYDFEAAAELARIAGLDSHPPEAVLSLVDNVVQEQIGTGNDVGSLWNAGNLYYSSGMYLEAAKCFFKILEEEMEHPQTDFQRLKKIAVLAASAAQNYRSGLTGTSGRIRKSEMFDEDVKSTEYPFLDKPWYKAEAFSLACTALSFFHSGDFKKGLRAAGTLSLYTNVIEATKVYSLIALNAVHLKRWDVVNEAIMTVVGLESTPKEFVNEMERFAERLFTKYSPNDVDTEKPLPTPKCMKCPERLPLLDVRCYACNTKYPICMGTGCPVVETEVWQCDFCNHHCAASVVVNLNVCPLCHTPRS